VNTHDVLAYSIASEAVRRIRSGSTPWSSLFSAESYVTASRAWPVPDFVLADSQNSLSIAGEFKPPQQSKREYLTGLGQAIAYARDFHYAVLVLPTIADDGYPIAEHIKSILAQGVMQSVPVALLKYDPALLTPSSAAFDEIHFFGPRTLPPAQVASLDQSFYAKWREMSPDEIFRLVCHSYEAARTVGSSLTIRDRAFDSLWQEIQAKAVYHWGGGIRNYKAANKVAIAKNYRNFLFHVGWTDNAGALTKEGLDALHVGTMYGANSRVFIDTIAKSVLLDGKHLILFNAIEEYQNALTHIDDEAAWLDGLEQFLEDKGLLKRNPHRALAAVQGSARQFLKAEKQLWKNLDLISPRGRYVFHPNRGFIFRWSRITDLVQS
jgi:hypothetical protein